ncbi:RNA polymerase sigma factor [Streptomyces sp. NBC_00091]|uniref:RNA polymerase sigma factor n=1 Tax=Streptomyces sp. NBC_00091 TaxID=2975648 RepID=UPI002256601F|nr:RNA polymerase sigma factor [Streptomyces sp. NBC_00091]MCX5377366.1 RNA polymerase sigma factor [Streptomyces sp. NBC_00091]
MTTTDTGPETDTATDAATSAADRAALVRAAQRGDRMATQDLLDLLTPYIGRLCGPIALQDGPDATQEALIVIFRSLGQLREPAALFGWARVIAVREAVRVARAAARAVPDPLEDVPARDDPQLAADIRDVLQRLTPAHRAVLVLRDLEGMDEHAVSALLGVPEPTVRTRLFRARRNFRKAWER